MSIEELVKKYIKRNGWSFSHDGECADAIRAALTEQTETHTIELRAYEAKVANLVEALRGVIRVADRATDEFDAAKAAILNAVGE